MTAVPLPLSECLCPAGPILCANCGGLVSRSKGSDAGILSKLEPDNWAWILEIDAERRLNSTLGTFRAIDRQYRAGIPVAAAVSQAVKEINSGISEIKKEVIKGMLERFSEMQVQNQSEATQLREIIREVVTQQTQDVMSKVKFLQEQGKSVAEIHGLLREAVGSMQTVMTAFQVPAVKGEEGELFSIKSLQEAFFGLPGVKIEPIGGSNETDALIKFCQNEVEVGRSLVEVKSRKTWSNTFLEQVRSDMQRYNAPMAIIVADKLPRNAKGKGFTLDSQVGLVAVTTQELLIPTVTMFHEIYTLTFKMQKRALDLSSLATNKDLIHYVNDNMNCLDDCKQIVDTVKDSELKVERLASAISTRLQNNNRKIAEILGKLDVPDGEAG